MSEAEMAAANERLANPPEFDLADSDKLGFFVVARLAARHEVKITLRPSPYGGLAAIVLLQHAMTVPSEDAHTDLERTLADRLQLPAAGRQTAYASPDAGFEASDIVSLADAEESVWSAPAQAHAVLSAAALDPDSDRLGADSSGLPQRLRNTSLSHQSAGTSPSPAVEAPQRDIASGGTQEELGALAALLQQGWLNGSSDNGQPDNT